MANTVSGVWVATLERFGYTLIVVEKTEQKAREAMASEYAQAYFRWNEINGYSTADEMAEHDEEYKEYFALAMEEVYCRKLEYGRVQWC